jgi:hypothetical protein
MLVGSQDAAPVGFNFNNKRCRNVKSEKAQKGEKAETGF